MPEGNIDSALSLDSKSKGLEFFKKHGAIISESIEKKYLKTSGLQDFENLYFVNCWHINRYESVAMWERYTKVGKGIAIQSTIGRLIRSMVTNPLVVLIGKIKYLDEKKEKLTNYNTIPYMFWKKKEYRSENELRLIANTFNQISAGTNFIQNGYISCKKGIFVFINLEILFKKIILAPGTENKKYEKCICDLRKYGLENVTVEKSKLDDKVYF